MKNILLYLLTGKWIGKNFYVFGEKLMVFEYTLYLFD